jgi:hypothetical protein
MFRTREKIHHEATPRHRLLHLYLSGLGPDLLAAGASLGRRFLCLIVSSFKTRQFAPAKK